MEDTLSNWKGRALLCSINVKTDHHSLQILVCEKSSYTSVLESTRVAPTHYLLAPTSSSCKRGQCAAMANMPSSLAEATNNEEKKVQL
jgi:hypothetical protein